MIINPIGWALLAATSICGATAVMSALKGEYAKAAFYIGFAVLLEPTSL